MRKYRILKETRRNGEIFYTPQYKYLLLNWHDLSSGSTDIEDAKSCIDYYIKEDLTKVIKKEIVPYPEKCKENKIS